MIVSLGRDSLGWARPVNTAYLRDAVSGTEQQDEWDTRKTGGCGRCAACMCARSFELGTAD